MDFIFNFGEVIYEYESTWWSEALGYILSIAFGIVGSIIILLIQFKKSTNNIFLKKIELATKEIYSSRSSSVLRNIYRPYLSAFIDKFFNTYGGISIPPNHEDGNQIHPLLIHYKKDENGKFEDRWEQYYLYVERLIEPLNSYNFLTSITILNRIKKLRKIRALASLVNQIEIVVGIHDGIIDDDAKNKIEHRKTSFIINHGEDKLDLLLRFETELEKLKKNWYDWLKLTINK